MVAGGEVLGVLPAVLVRAAGGVMVHHPVPAPSPPAPRQPHALLAAAVQSRPDRYSELVR